MNRPRRQGREAPTTTRCSSKTLDECKAIQLEHRQAMEARAKEKGTTLMAARQNACDRMQARGFFSEQMSETEGRLLKPVSGAMMLGVGILLIAAPAALNDLRVALVLLVGSIGFFGLVHWLRKPVQGADNE
ncbi:MAG: hypothetical protein ABTS16_06235 [Candidatus Accumulibacter phosphatis]|jgi:hypothetical protein|uniref:hypothetical protein n=2 Tax=Candidatus Accumulibacter TaxID=327159 RepID=UPI002FC30F1E